MSGRSVLRYRAPIPSERRPRIAPGHEGAVAVEALRLAVTEHPTLTVQHRAAGSPEHGIAGRRIPFHRGSEARIDVGLTLRHDAEFQRRACGAPLGDRKAGQEGFRLGIAMRTAGQRRPGGRGGLAGGEPSYRDGCRKSGSGHHSADLRGRAPGPEPFQGRGIDGTRHRQTFGDEPDIDRELPIAVEELPRAVERIDQDEASRRGWDVSPRRGLLGENRPARQMFGQGREDQGFRLLVGLRHGACVRFQPRFAAPCVNLHDDSAGFDAKSREEFGQPVAHSIVELRRG